MGRTLILAFSLLFGVLYVISGTEFKRDRMRVFLVLKLGFATIAIGENEGAEVARLYQLLPCSTKEEIRIFFTNIPNAMFTAFRCFTGECSQSHHGFYRVTQAIGCPCPGITDDGRPLQWFLFELLGWPFVFAYVACYMLVTMGIFNVILAVACLRITYIHDM